MKKIAVRENGLALQDIDDRTPELEMLAVNQKDGSAIKYVRHPDEELQEISHARRWTTQRKKRNGDFDKIYNSLTFRKKL